MSLIFLFLSGETGFWGEVHFNASDIDGDGLLNLTEFNEYVPFNSLNIGLLNTL